MTNRPIQVGLERSGEELPGVLQGRRYGLLANQASVDDRFVYSWDRLSHTVPGTLTAIFSPQHGLWCEQQANMIESPHGWHESLQVPVYSLYSETRTLTDEMLAEIDCLVIDLQDVGTRVYTFSWTILHCLQACAQQGIPAVILDRPNPLGGTCIEGPLLQPGFTSFVGELTIPMRHGLTLAELARLAVSELAIDVELSVVPMAGWSRDMLWRDTGRSWIPPSPNLPGPAAVAVYPGQVLLEGTNLSEGRGTTTPFEVCGAPYVAERDLARRLNELRLPGAVFRPVRFVPTFDKWQGQGCGGVAVHVTAEREFPPFLATVSLIATVAELYRDAFQWLPPPYEYERHHPPIDIIFGSDELRRMLTDRLREPGGRGAGPIPREELTRWTAVPKDAWCDRVREILVYA